MMSAVAPALRIPSVTHSANLSWVGGSEDLLGSSLVMDYTRHTARRPVEAVSTHYMALGHVAARQSRAGRAPIPPCPATWSGYPESSAPPVAGRRWPITRWPASLGPHRSRFSACGVGTGVEPVTARFSVWCSTTELTWLTRPSVRTHLRNARRQPPHMRTGHRAPLARPYHCFRRDAGGSRTHLDRVAAGCRAVWLQRHIGRVSQGV